jgi:WD40 repeat protein
MKEEETKAKKTYCVCALGSRDRTLSVWLTKTSRPLCVVHDLFDNPVVDLAWSKRPKPALLACSMDGTIVCIEFEHAEIGYPLSKPETEEFFMNKYNYDVNATISIKDTNVPQFNAASAAAAKEKEALKFIENYDILLAQERKQNELLEKKQHQQIKFEDSNQSTNMTTTSSNTQTLEVLINITIYTNIYVIRRLYSYCFEGSKTNRATFTRRSASNYSDLCV